MNERGFTLVELLVVILIIGILAAIALPTFLGQADKARDTEAKADVRNAVTQMEACFTADETYTGCPSAEHPFATGVVPALLDGGSRYRVTKLSASGTSFTITRLVSGYSRTCTQAGAGGCNADASW